MTFKETITNKRVFEPNFKSTDLLWDEDYTFIQISLNFPENFDSDKCTEKIKKP